MESVNPKVCPSHRKIELTRNPKKNSPLPEVSTEGVALCTFKDPNLAEKLTNLAEIQDFVFNRWSLWRLFFQSIGSLSFVNR